MTGTPYSLAVRVSIGLIFVYRRLAPWWVRSLCRFQPTCSEYALIALEHYGFCQGWRMAVDRLLRCRPPNGGYDHPVAGATPGRSVSEISRHLLRDERGGCGGGPSEERRRSWWDWTGGCGDPTGCIDLGDMFSGLGESVGCVGEGCGGCDLGCALCLVIGVVGLVAAVLVVSSSAMP